MVKYSKSKIEIMYSFANLLKNHNLSNITISSIVENSKVTKGTFYNNFKNISEVIIFMEHYIDDECYYKLNEIKTNTQHKEILNTFGDIIFPLIYKKRDLIKIMYHSNLNGEWDDFLEKRYYNWSMENLFNTYKPFYSPLNKNTTCKLFVHDILYLLKMWLTQPIPKNPKDAKKIFLELLMIPPLKLLQQ